MIVLSNTLKYPKVSENITDTAGEELHIFTEFDSPTHRVLNVYTGP